MRFSTIGPIQPHTYRALLTVAASAALVLAAVAPAQADEDVITPMYTLASVNGDFGVKLARHSNGGLQATAYNSTGTDQKFDLGVNVEGRDDIDNLWQDGIGGFSNAFTQTVQPGGQAVTDIPDFPGKTYYFYSEDSEGSRAELGHYIASGTWMTLRIDGNENGPTAINYGTDLTVEGPEGPAEAHPNDEIQLDAPIGDATDAYAVPTSKVRNAFNTDSLVVDEDAAAGMLNFDQVDAIYLGTLRSVGGTVGGSVALPSDMASGDYTVFLGRADAHYYPAGPASAAGEPVSNLKVTPNGATQAGSNVPVSPRTADGETPVAFTFANVTNPGTTTVMPTATAPAATGFSVLGGSTPQYYNLETTATFSGAVTVCVNFSTSDLTEAQASSQHLYHYTNGAWVDITTSQGLGYACGSTVSFSPFAVGTPKPVAAPGVKFLAPVKTTGSTTAIAGLPYLLSFKGAKGLSLASASPVTQQANCKTGAPIGSVVKAKGALVYLPKLGTYTYAWATERSWKNTCRTFTLTLKDDSVGKATFVLK